MTRAAKRGISNAAAMAVCAVCLVAAAAIVMVPVVALAHRQADPPPPLHTPVDRVSIDVAWDAARASNVALTADFSQRSPACTDHLADIGRAGRLDAGSLLGAHVPAVVRQDASTDIAADAARDRLVTVRLRPGETEVVLGHSVAGPVHPFRRMAMSWVRGAYAGGHAAVIPAEAAEWHGAVTSTRLVQPVDALGHRLPVEPVVRRHVYPTSLSAHGESIALHIGRLYDRATRLVAVACAEEPGSARGPSPNLEKWTPEVSDQIRLHFRGLFTYCVSA